jgi:hypothetical protein
MMFAPIAAPEIIPLGFVLVAVFPGFVPVFQFGVIVH